MTTQPYTDPDVGKTPEQLFAERSKRVQDAMQLKRPDRIPVILDASYMLAEMYASRGARQGGTSTTASRSTSPTR